MRSTCRSNTPPLDCTSKLEKGSTVGRGRLVLIEDLPNMNAPEVRKTVQDELNIYLMSKRSIVPVVIILTEPSGISGVGLKSDLARYYTVKGFIRNYHKDLIKFSITTIQFLPVPPSLIKKSLKRVASLEFGSRGQDTAREYALVYIENIADYCAGDLRHAVNTFQFYCTSDPHHRLANTSLATKDVYKSIYSSAGNILYNKFARQSCTTGVSPEINDVTEKVSVDPNTFVLFLHQNYLDFFTDIEDVEGAANCFSIADLFERKLFVEDLLCSYYLSISSRGIVCHNKSPAPNTYRKLLFPDFWRVASRKKALENSIDSLATCIGRTSDILSFRDVLRSFAAATDILPLCGKIILSVGRTTPGASAAETTTDVEHLSYILMCRKSQTRCMSRKDLVCNSRMGYYMEDEVEEC